MFILNIFSDCIAACKKKSCINEEKWIIKYDGQSIVSFSFIYMYCDVAWAVSGERVVGRTEFIREQNMNAYEFRAHWKDIFF